MAMPIRNRISARIRAFADLVAYTTISVTTSDYKNKKSGSTNMILAPRLLIKQKRQKQVD